MGKNKDRFGDDNLDFITVIPREKQSESNKAKTKKVI